MVLLAGHQRELGCLHFAPGMVEGFFVGTGQTTDCVLASCCTFRSVSDLPTLLGSKRRMPRMQPHITSYILMPALTGLVGLRIVLITLMTTLRIIVSIKLALWGLVLVPLLILSSKTFHQLARLLARIATLLFPLSLGARLRKIGYQSTVIIVPQTIHTATHLLAAIVHALIQVLRLSLLRPQSRCFQGATFPPKVVVS